MPAFEPFIGQGVFVMSRGIQKNFNQTIDMSFRAGKGGLIQSKMMDDG